ncbi:hypothetical protein AMS68_000314 [Peltaster fructicola]|uniref:Uncharacterized protein n=1 Tax=Peltaster fructicola TaxID=286661 RepID=A0A6H0XJ98_9PEZI|nr:hypothetical protein AMS68_000314 [Peltaster fructicola]
MLSTNAAISNTMPHHSQDPSKRKQTFAIPSPFQPASCNLKPLLEQCDPTKVYLFHIDRSHADYKRNIFLVPVLLNGTIGLLLLWRIYAAAPTYWAMILSMIGAQSSANVDITTSTRKQQILLVLRRAALIFLDFLLLRLVGPWPITFFFERPSNPVTWRFKLGFQAQEVIARVSRGWGAEDLLSGTKKGGESPFFKTRINTAVDKETMAKTGYLMMDRSWDLDFQLMLDAHTLLKRKDLTQTDIDCVALAHMESPIGWCEWRWQKPTSSDEELHKTLATLRAEAAASK